MPLMGVDTRRVYLITSAIGGMLAGLASCLLVLQYDVHPFIGLTFGPITFMICVLGGLGNMIGGFVAAFVFAEIISVAGPLHGPGVGLRVRLRVLRGDDVRAPAGADRAAHMNGLEALGDRRRGPGGAAVRLPRALPAAHRGDHPDLVVRLYLLVGDGTLRPGVARAWRVLRHRRLRHRAAVEQLPPDAVDRHSAGDAGRGDRGAC